MQTNYVIAAWTGERRYEAGLNHYIKKHIETLNRYKHNLTQVTIMWPDNPLEDPKITEWLNGLNNLVDGTPVIKHKRRNIGLSYGSYSDCFGIYGQAFDYYILIEDDYCFVVDHFDQLLIDMYKQCGGYLCSKVGGRPGTRSFHAADSNGIVSADVLRKVYLENNNSLPHIRSSSYRKEGGQIAFSQAFIDSGFEINQLADVYRIPYLNFRKEYIMYGPTDGFILLVPVQCLNDKCEVRYELFV